MPLLSQTWSDSWNNWQTKKKKNTTHIDNFVFIYLVHVMFYAVVFYFCITFTVVCLVHKHLKKVPFGCFYNLYMGLSYMLKFRHVLGYLLYKKHKNF